jgi:hypothetical protein
MGRRQVADGGDGLEILKVDANVLNTKSWRNDNGGSSNLGAGGGG